jgi:hypothetical protein
MSDGGFFTVDRSVWDHPLFTKEKFTEIQAWLWLISSAAWEPSRVRVGRAFFDLQRGQCAFSLRFMAQKWMWSEARVRRFLDRLSNDAAVLLQATRDATQITICKYNDYQQKRRTDVVSIDAPVESESTNPRRKEEEINNKQLNKIEETKIPCSAKKYAFESGVIKLNQKDFDNWKVSFSYLDLRAELIAMTPWANGIPEKWFHAVPNALAKRNREAKAHQDAPLFVNRRADPRL